jgi:hypothetical protein
MYLVMQVWDIFFWYPGCSQNWLCSRKNELTPNNSGNSLISVQLPCDNSSIGGALQLMPTNQLYFRFEGRTG